MRSTRVFLLAACGGLFLADAAHAQATKAEEWEFSTAAFFQSTKPKGDEAFEILSVPLRLGYFVTDRFELEGEALLTHLFDAGARSTGITSALRLAYHFGDDGVVPFLFAGGGLGNGIEIGNSAVDTGETRPHWQVGAGLKAFVADQVAIRADYRFAQFTDTDDSIFSNAVDTHRVFIGVSLFAR